MFAVSECTIEGQVYTTCGTACPSTCTHQPYICTQQCVFGCQCPFGTVLDEVNNRCVKIEDCRTYNSLVYHFQLSSSSIIILKIIKS